MSFAKQLNHSCQVSMTRIRLHGHGSRLSPSRASYLLGGPSSGWYMHVDSWRSLNSSTHLQCDVRRKFLIMVILHSKKWFFPSVAGWLSWIKKVKLFASSVSTFLVLLLRSRLMARSLDSTALNFFRNLGCNVYPTPHILIATSCLSYLLASQFTKRKIANQKELKIFLNEKEHPLRDYVCLPLLEFPYPGSWPAWPSAYRIEVPWEVSSLPVHTQWKRLRPLRTISYHRVLWASRYISHPMQSVTTLPQSCSTHHSF